MKQKQKQKQNQFLFKGHGKCIHYTMLLEQPFTRNHLLLLA